MKSLLPLAGVLLAPLAPLTACTASVYHPTKSGAEMEADVGLCTRQANRRYWMDPVAALYNAYDCLEAKGYRRNERDFAARVEQALGERPPPPGKDAPRAPCRVPCRR